jgi:ABC-2 type transport system permease protein
MTVARRIGPARARATTAIAVLARREWLRLFRQPPRVVAALGTALMLWLVVGGGLGGSMQVASTGPAADALGQIPYSLYLVPGVMTVVAMFASIFSNISVIEDRREGFLQGILVAPVPHASIAAGIIVGGSTVAGAQAALMLPLAWLAGASVDLPRALLALVGVLLAAISLQSLGLAFAWRCRDAGSFHAVMNLLFMPLWLLSDAFFPVRGAAEPLATIIRWNPLSWCGSVVRDALIGSQGLPWPALIGAAFFAALAFAAAVLAVAGGRR